MRLIIHPEFFCVKNIWTASAGEDGIFRPDVRLLLICTKKELAKKLAVNLYRITCIQYLQSQIGAIDNILRQFGSTDNTLKHQIPDDLSDSLQGDFPTMPDFQDLFRGLHSRPLVPADFFDLKSPYRQFILSHLQNEYSWIIDWYLTDYEKNTDHPEQLIFPVKLGFNVRSKSEVLIADRLYEEGILLHYEEKLFLSDHSCRPDFNLPITLYEKYKWEHFGAMDKLREARYWPIWTIKCFRGLICSRLMRPNRIH